MKVLAFVFLTLIGTSQAGIGCSLCEGLISSIDSWLKEHEQNIEGKAMQYCGELGPLSSKCKALVNEYLPQIIDDLGKGDDQNTICNLIDDLCDEDKKVPSFNMECTICEAILKIIAKLGTNEEPKIEQVADEVCKTLGGFFEHECESLVHEYVPKLIDALNDGKTEQEACSYVGLCSSQKVVAKAVKKETKGVECSLCEALVSFIATLLNNNEGDIKKQLDQYCQDLPVLQSTCESIVNEYLGKIIAYLKQGKDQEYICAEIDFCDSKTRMIVEKVFTALAKGQTKSVKCDICEKLCKWIEDYGVNKGISAIKHYVDGKCDDLPFIGSVCKDIVNDLLDKIVPLLQKDLPPKKVCQEVDLC
jgi:saposin